MDPRDLNELRSVEELAAYQTEVRGRIVELDNEFAGLPLPDDERAEYVALEASDKEIDKRVAELNKRKADVDRFAQNGGTEPTRDAFQTQRPAATRTENIWDLSSIRTSVSRPEDATQELRTRALRALELARFPQAPSRDEARTHAERLIDRLDGDNGRISRHILETGSPEYQRAFGKYVSGRPLSNRESDVLSRALSLTGSAGGFAVPFELDPSIIPTSNLAVNPFRSIARVEQITVDEWRGVSSAGITAAYAAEATATSDNAPTLAQPTISTEKAQAFIPFSIEVGMDWPSLQAEMGRLLQDSKDELEATKFALGSGTNEPQGVITGATTVFTASNTNSVVVADIYGLEAALGARFRPRASLVMNRAVAQKIRQFDTAGGANLWIDTLKSGLQNNVPTNGSFGANLLGYPTYEASAMSSAFTTGQLVGVLGDFNYYVIVDRVGLTVEYIPHLFDTTNNRPTGQRGLYAYWRNGAGVISPNAFRVLKLA